MTSYKLAPVQFPALQLCSLIVCLACYIVPATFCMAQNSVAASDKELAEAIRLIDSPEEEDRERVEKFIRGYLTGNPQSAEAYCVLALLCFDQDRIDEASSVIDRIQKQKITLNSTMKGMVGQIRLCCAISNSDREESEKLFKAMVHAVQRDNTAAEDKKSYCQTLGTIVAILENIPEESPVSADLLATGHAAMKSLSNKSMAFHYDESYQAAAKRVSEINRWYETFSGASAEERAQEVERLQSELDVLKEPLTIAIDAAQIANRNQKEIAKQSIKDLRELNGLRAIAVTNLNTPLPGHPGAEPVLPVIPTRDSIFVSEFKAVQKRDSKGNIVTEQERRPQSEIDAERDRKHESAMSTYRNHKAEYDRNIVIYRQTLKTWLDDEQRRKKTATEELEKIDEKRKTVEEENAQALTDKKTTSQDLAKLRAEIKEKQLAHECANLAAVAANSGKKFSAMQPHYFNVITIASEKQRLLNSTR